MKRMHTALVLGIVMLSLPASALAAADLFNLQFNAPGQGNQQTGAAVVGTSGDYWNNLQSLGSGLQTLWDASSSLNSVTFSWNSDGAYDTWASGFTNTPYSNLMSGYLYAYSTNSYDLTFSGLQANSAFSAYIYSQGDDHPNRQLSVTDLVSSNNYTTLICNPTLSTFVAGQNYLLINGTTDANGQVKFRYNKASSSEANINGIQLQALAVPEPSTYALLCISLGVVGYARKKMMKPTP